MRPAGGNSIIFTTFFFSFLLSSTLLLLNIYKLMMTLMDCKCLKSKVVIRIDLILIRTMQNAIK